MNESYDAHKRGFMDVIAVYLIYAFIGAFAGVLGGLLGIGGGVIAVPCLLYLFNYLDFPVDHVMHMAIATSLAAMIFNTAVSAWVHHKHNHVLWQVFRRCVPGLILGSILGALIANFLSGIILEVFFGFFLCALAFHFYRQKAIIEGTHKLPSPFVLNSLGAGIGMISNLLGIGGGSLTVPLLTSFKIRDKNAIGTSSAITCVTMICGSISYMVLGWKDLPFQPLGLINPPALFIVGVSALLLAPVGVKLTSIINPQKTRRIFAAVLALTGISLLINAF
jgi:uncharacterized membrane protein YfcA